MLRLMHRGWFKAYKKTITARFHYSKDAARRRGKVWGLTTEEYAAVAFLPCHYCHSGNSVETGIGLDRKDNSKGYFLENVVPCCEICNLARGDRLSYEEMLIVGKAIEEVKLARRSKLISDIGTLHQPSQNSGVASP